MILADLTYAYNPVSGGVRTYIDAKRNYIQSHTDWQHVLIIPGAEDAVTRDGRLTTVQIKSRILPISPPYRIVLRLGSVVEALRQSAPDLIEIGSLYTLPWAAFRYRKSRPVALAGFYHTDFADAYVRPTAEKALGKRLGGLVGRGASRYVRSVYSRCEMTLTASPQSAQALRAMGLPRVEHTPLGVDLELWNPSRRDPRFREELGIAHDARLMIYVGRLDAEKRVSMLRDAVMQLPDSPPPVLLYVGQGPQEQELKAFSQTTDRIHVLPFEDDKLRLARMVASADIYLAGNPNETFGLSVVEAQASGLPVVGVRSGALIERVTSELGELCEADDATQMSAAIERLFGRTDLYAIPAAARQHVAERFGWATSLERILNLYVDLLRNRNGSS